MKDPFFSDPRLYFFENNEKKSYRGKIYKLYIVFSAKKL